LGPLIAALRLESDAETDKVAELRTRLKGALAALARLEQLRGEGEFSQGAEEGIREFYEERARRYEEGIKAGGTTEEYAESSATWRKWRRELIAAERDALLSSRDAGEIGPEAMRRIERDLDLEESRIGG
jgi:hypothetical protein